MGIRGRHLGAVALALTALVLVAAAVAVAAQAPRRPVKIKGAPGSGAEVAYGDSQVLLLNAGFGDSTGSITRVNLDGTVDRTFGNEGTVDIYAEDAVVTADGKILVATASHPEGGLGIRSRARVTRLLPDGRPDRTFGKAGNADISFGRHYDYGQALAVAADGDILLGGLRVDHADRYGSLANLAVARLRPDGTLDRSFARAGVRTVAVGGEIEVMGIAAAPSGGIVVEYGVPGEAILVKLDRGGSLDRGFGDRGYGPIRGKRARGGVGNLLHLNSGFVALPDGRLLVSASGPHPPGVRDAVAVGVRADGRIDRSYGNEGWLSLPAGAKSSARGLAPLPGGGVAVGTIFHGAATGADLGAAVFDRDGHPSPSFAGRGSCRASVDGDQETVDVTAVGRVPVALSSRFDGQSLLVCRPSR